MGLKISEEDISFAEQAERDLQKTELADALENGSYSAIMREFKDIEDGKKQTTRHNQATKQSMKQSVKQNKELDAIKFDIHLDVFRIEYMIVSLFLIFIFFLCTSGARAEKRLLANAAIVEGEITESSHMTKAGIGIHSGGKTSDDYINRVSYEVDGTYYENIYYNRSSEEQLGAMVSVYYKESQPERISDGVYGSHRLTIVCVVLGIGLMISVGLLILLFVKPKLGIMIAMILNPLYRLRAK